MEFDKYSPSQEKRRQERLKRKKQKRAYDDELDGDIELLHKNPKHRRNKKKSERPELWSDDDLGDEDLKTSPKPQQKKRRMGDEKWFDDEWDA